MRRQQSKGKDVVHQLKVSLEDMYNGTTKRLSLQKNVICSRCKGKGGKEGAVSKCGTCRGTGIQVKVHHIGPGMMQQVNTCLVYWCLSMFLTWVFLQINRYSNQYTDTNT